ncbi:MAG: NAD(P)-dependent oxidoreductase [Hyphomonadaceae bacterium]
MPNDRGAPAGAINVLALMNLSDTQAAQVRAVDPRVNLTLGYADFLPEMARDWNRDGAVPADAEPPDAADRRAALLREADVMLMSLPYPRAMKGRAPKVQWGHFGFAGVSNLMGSDWWGGAPVVTSSRGHTRALPIAEAVMGAIYLFARRWDYAVEATRRGEMNPRTFPRMKAVGGKTLGVVGLGGIGGEAARLARGNGMRVVATRRSALARQENVDGVDVLYPAADLHAMLAESDFVAVCTMWTPETEGMIDKAAFAAMKDGAYLINIARGEVIDEPAMIEALRSGKIAGAQLDVWKDDLRRMPPSPDLLALPNVVLTPHVSGLTDDPSARGVDLFCDNLRRFLDGKPLVNTIDWSRGY